MRDKTAQFLLIFTAFVAAFAVGYTADYARPRLIVDPEFIYVVGSVVAIGVFFIVLALWAAVGPIIYWRRFFYLLLALCIATGMAALGYFGFPPWT